MQEASSGHLWEHKNSYDDLFQSTPGSCTCLNPCTSNINTEIPLNPVTKLRDRGFVLELHGNPVKVGHGEHGEKEE